MAPPTGPSRPGRNAPIPREPRSAHREQAPRRDDTTTGGFRRESRRDNNNNNQLPPPSGPKKKSGQEASRREHEAASAAIVERKKKQQQQQVTTPLPPPPAAPPSPKVIIDAPPSFDINAVGPHPGYIMQTEKFVGEWRIQQALRKLGTDLKDEQWRIQGVGCMEQANALLLKAMPMSTITTATAYFHRFRLQNSLEQHHLVEVVASALYLASKTENTAQKPNQIAAACLNVGVPAADRRSPEEDFFDAMSDRIVDLERLMLEATSFEFAYLDPKRIALEILSTHFNIRWRAGSAEDDNIIRLALDLSKDVNYTFAVIKHSVTANAVAIAELAMRLSDRGLKWDSQLRPGKALDADTQRRIAAYEHKFGASDKLRDPHNPYRLFLTSRVQVLETVFDLMDLYTLHRTATHVGPRFSNEHIMQHKIALNRIALRHATPRHARWPADAELRRSLASDYYVDRLKLEREVPVPAGGTEEDAAAAATGTGATGTNGHATPPAKGESGDAGVSVGASAVERRQLIAVRRFVLQGSDAKREKSVLDEYFVTNEEEYEREHEEEDGWESVSSEDEEPRDSRR